MSTHPRPQRRRSAAEWAALIERWQLSGQDVTAFARRHRLSERSLVWWRWRLRSRAPAPKLDFVPLVAAPEPAAPVSCTIDTHDGRRLTLTGPQHLLIDAITTALTRTA
jgi:hypothetical protein